MGAESTDNRQPPVSSLKPAVRRGWLYWVKRVVCDIIIGYALICAGVFMLQKRLVYMPEKDKEDNLSPRLFGFAPGQANAIETRTPDNLTLHGWHVLGTRPGAVRDSSWSTAAGVDLFFCGNAGNRSGRGDKFKRLARLGVDVACFDYRGYGDSEGSPDEEGLARDARAAWNYLRGQNVPASSIVIHGESLGGGVAVRLAAELCAENTPPAGLILEATFPRLKAVASLHYPYLPVALILTQRFPSVERIPALTCPLLMLHGTRDQIIPVALGRELFDAAPERAASGIKKEFVELPKCEHNDIGFRNAEEYVVKVSGFYQQLFPALNATPVPHGG